MATETLFCDCCAEVRDQNIELTCQFCGYVLHIGKEPPPIRAECVIVADDSASVRQLLQGALLNTRMAKEVLLFEDGIEFIKGYLERVTAQESIDLAILDLNMPKMDGTMTAKVMRFIEEQFRLKPIPILFFSSDKADESLKKKLRQFLPASYMNKSSEGDPQKMADRVIQVVMNILKRAKEDKKSS